MALEYYGFNRNPVSPLFGKTRGANSFLIDGLGPEEWIARETARTGVKPTFDDFYNILRDRLNESANSIFGPGGVSAKFGKNAIGLESFMSFTNGTNLADIQQVLGDKAFRNWERLAEVISKGSTATDSRVFGFDLETFGDITNPKATRSEIGITELAIGQRDYAGSGVAGRMIKDNGGGSFVFGINNDQQTYLNSLVKKFKEHGWDRLTQSEQVSLSRVSRYRGNDSVVFSTIQNTIFDPNNTSGKGYLVINKLAEEQLSLEAFESGIKNLRKAYNYDKDKVHTIEETLDAFMSWFTHLDEDKDIIYGANSSFDYNGLRRALEGMSDGVKKQDYLKALDAMEARTVDVVYAARVAAAANGQTITEYMKSFNGIAGNATVQGQAEALLFNFVQEHEGFLDVGNEGKLADFHANNILKLFTGDGNTAREDLRKTITTIGTGAEDVSLDDVTLFIRYGELDKTRGYEYAYRPGGNSGTGQTIANYSLKGEYYKFDLEHSGKYQTKAGKDRYVLTLTSAGDIITGGNSDNATRIVLTADSLDELRKRAENIAKASSLFKDGEISNEEIIAQQIAKYQDDGRRQFQKLISPTDVRTVRQDGSTVSYGGVRTLSDMYSVMDRITAETGTKFALPIDITPQEIEKRTKDIIDIFGDKSANRFGETKLPFISGDYQLKSFLAFSTTLDNERDLHEYLMQVVGTKFGVLDDSGIPDFSKLSPEDNVRATALYQGLYNGIIDVMGSGDASLKQTVAHQSYLDKFRLDIKPLTDNETFFHVNLHSVGETSSDFNRYLKALDEQGRISDFEKVIDNLRGRSIISSDTYRATIELFENVSQNNITERRRGLHDVAERIAVGIHEYKNVPIPDREYAHPKYSVAGKTTSNLYKSYIDRATGAEISFSERFAAVRSQVDDVVSEITESFSNVSYQNYSTFHGQQITDVSKKILGRLNIEETPDKLRLVEQIFNAVEEDPTGKLVPKSYSLQNYADNGIFSFLVSSDEAESSMFLLHTNQSNRAKLQQMIESGKYNDAFSSLYSLRNSDIASVAAIEELPYIKKYQVDDTTALMAVKQGDSFERFLIQTLRTYEGDDGKLRAVLDTPDMMLLSAHRQAGASPIEHILEGDFEKATSIYRRIFGDILKEMPGPGDISGVDRVMSLTYNDVMHAYEHRLVGGLDEIFKSFVITNPYGVAVDERNHAQELVYQFGRVLGMDINDYKGNFNDYAKDVMATSQWDEFFRRRLTSGKIIDEPWTLRDSRAGFQTQITWRNELTPPRNAYRGNVIYNYDFDRSILEMMKDMVKVEDIVETYGHGDASKVVIDSITEDSLKRLFTIDGNIASNLTSSVTNILKALPDPEFISMIGSESAVERGSMYYGFDGTNYFTRNYGDAHNFSGMYSMMRPLYHQQGNALKYDIKDIDTSYFNGTARTIKNIKAGEPDFQASGITFGTSLLSDVEYKSRLKLNQGRSLKGETEFLSRIKVMNDYVMEESFDRLARSQNPDYAAQVLRDLETQFPGHKLTEAQYDEALIYLKNNLGSMYQDKVIASPALMDQSVFRVNDSLKVEMDLSRMDNESTKKILMDLKAQAEREGGSVIITRDTILGRRAGRRPSSSYDVYWDKTDSYLTVQNIKELLQGLDDKNPEFRTRVKTVTSDVFDKKLMVNGMEKGTIHTIDVRKFTKALGLDPSSEDDVKAIRWLASTIFGELTDGAMIAMNPGIAKHGGVAGAESLWNVIVKNYEEAGKVGQLSTKLNKFLADNPEFYPRENDVARREAAQNTAYFKSVMLDGQQRLVGDASRIERQAQFVEQFYRDIITSDSGSATTRRINARIMSEYEDLLRTNSFIGTVHHQLMNTHMGTHFKIDRRIEQGWQMRGINQGYTGSELEPFLQWVEEFRRHAYDYDATGTALEEAGFDEIEAMANFYSRSKNRGRIIARQKLEEMQNGIVGLVRALDYMEAPENFGKTQGNNVVHININEVIGNRLNHVDTGIDPSNLDASIFLTDGKPSKFLLDHAKGQNLNETFNIMLDFGEDVTIAVKNAQGETVDRTYSGLLIPIVTGNSINQDKILYQNQPREIAKLISRIRRYSQTEESGYLESVLKYYLEDYKRAISKETAIMKKDSDIYKATRTYIAPNSGEFMGQDEATPFLRKQMEWTPAATTENPAPKSLRQLIHERDEISKKFVGQSTAATRDANLIKQYNEVENQISSYLKQMASEAKDTMKRGGDLGEFITLDPSSPLAKVKGLAVGISEEGFERMGIDFGYIAEQLTADIESNPRGRYNYENLANFISDNNIMKRLDDIRTDVALNYEISDIGTKYLGEFWDILDSHNVDSDDFRAFLDKRGHGHIADIDGILAHNANGIIGDINEYSANLRLYSKDVLAYYHKKFKGAPLPESLQNLEQLQTDLRKDIYKVLRERFKESGIAQDYMRQVGTYAEFNRFPVMRSQPIVRLILDDTVSGVQVRVNNPILSSLTNLDFDGDKIFIAMLSNGMGILRDNDRRIQYAQHITAKFLENQAPDLLADLIKQKKNIISDNPNAVNAQKAELLSIIDAEKFDTGLKSYLSQVQNIDGIYKANFGNASIDDALKILKDSGKDGPLAGLYQAALASQEVADVFDKEITNVMFNEYAQVSGLVARIRKNNIGHISTPAYKLRETLIEAYFNRNENLSEENKATIQRILHGLSNMDSESGGILSIAEQKVIDPKHAKDSLILQKADLFSKNVKLLLEEGFSGTTDDAINQKAIKSRHTAIMGMLEAVGTKAFGYDFSNKKYADIAEYFIFDGDGHIDNQTLQDIRTAIANNDTSYSHTVNGVNISFKTLEQFMTMRDLNEAVSNIGDISYIYKNYVGAKDYLYMKDYIKSISHFSDEQIRKMLEYSTSMDATVLDIFTRDNTMVSPFIEGNIYVASEMTKNKRGPGVYAASSRYIYHDGEFHNIIRNSNTGLFEIGDVVNLDESKVVIPSAKVSIGDLNIHDVELEAAIRSTRNADEVRTILDYSIFDGNNIRTSLPELRRGTGHYGQDFIQGIGLGDDELKQLQEYVTAADYAKHIKGYDIDGSDSGANLLRRINQKIAQEYQGNKSGLDATGANIDIMAQYRKYFTDAIAASDEDLLDDLISDSKVITGNFDLQKYVEQLDLIHQRAYNIGSMYNSAEASFEVLKNYSKSDDLTRFLSKTDKKALNRQINRQQRTIGNMLDTLFAIGRTDLAPYERAIYDLFDNTDAMDDFFGWSKSNLGDMKVGFGEYLGINFRNLNAADKEVILREAKWILDKSKDDASLLTPELEHAIKTTMGRLEGYDTQVNPSALSGIVRAGMDTHDSLISIKQINDGIIASLASRNYDNAKKVREQIKSNMSQAQRIIEDYQNKASTSGTPLNGPGKQTLHGSILDSIQKLNLTGKQVGMGIAALAGLGLVNKLLHPSHQNSPLEAGKSGASQPPIHAPNGQGAPATPGLTRTIYHDQASGLDFKVSARTRGQIDGRSMQRTLHKSGIDNAQLYIHNDTTNVSNNWLSNKFAELAE